MSDTEKTEPKRGTCHICRRSLRLTKDGMVWPHGGSDKTVWPPQRCAGAGEKPAAE